MPIITEVWRNTYYDSVTLMLGSSMMEALPGIDEAMVLMGTDRNDTVIRASGLLADGCGEFGSNDIVIGMRADSEQAARDAIAELERFLTSKKGSGNRKAAAHTLDGALREDPGIDLAMISVPGRYARAEAEKALDAGLHVMLFSDNVALEDEIALKDRALEKGLLMMGPDCGTAIVNGCALGFANVVRRGNIGLVGAAGTGLQEITVLIDRLGGGVSQALGTGGRDLKEDVGGRMMDLCLEALRDDLATEVIAILSKPPHPSVVEKMKRIISTIEKPSAPTPTRSRARTPSSPRTARNAPASRCVSPASGFPRRTRRGSPGPLRAKPRSSPPASAGCAGSTRAGRSATRPCSPSAMRASPHTPTSPSMPTCSSTTPT